nr:reverse transcriptase domain-containing protein [Tanacetum cinerariifolium]
MIQQVQNSCQFHGLPDDNANKHLDKFLHVTQSIKVNGVTDDALCLYLFPHSLTYHVTTWFDRLPRNSNNTFDQMAKMFLGKYFPPSMVTKLRNEITRPDESLFKAWERYKLSIDRCPNHNMLPVTQIDTFYNGLTLRHRDTINAVAGGTFMKRRPEECYDLMENMTTHHNDWDTSAQQSESSSSITSSFDLKIIALKAEMEEINKNLMRVLQINQQVKALTPNCETCGGPHSYNDCPATFGQTQNVYTLREPIKVMNTASSLGSRTLPSNTITNPKEDLKGITTRSGNAYQGPTIPTTSSSLPEVLERETEVTKDTVPPTNNESTKDVQPLVFQNESPILNSEPIVAPIIEPVVAPTGRALIDVFKGELTLRVGKEAIPFNLDQTSRYSANYNDMTGNRIDVIDMACEEYSQEVLGFFDLIASGNPTPYYDPIISTSSSTLTPFGDSDFLFEEVDAFLALKDDATSPEVDQSYYDSEGDILLLEAFLNDDPSLPPPTQGNYLPQVPKELKIFKAKNDKSLINDLPSPWVSLVHYVPKKGGFTVVENEENELILTRLVTGWNVCIDYRKLNEATRKNHFSLPFTDQMLERLAGNEYYCFFDGFSAYIQIPIDQKDQEKTTITCPYGKFAYRRMPFGLSNASSTFQRCMMAIFHDIKKTMEVFMDDFSEKSHFMVKEDIILVHKISKNGIEVDKAKVDVIAKLPHPTTVKGGVFTARKPLTFLRLATMDPPGDIMARTTRPRRCLTSDFIGPQSTVMPMTWSNLVTLVNVRERFHNKMKCLKIPSKFSKFLTFGHRLHGAVPVFTREQIYTRGRRLLVEMGRIESAPHQRRPSGLQILEISLC